MSLASEVITSFTPQVIFGMFGGFVGGIYGINKKGYDVKISIILIFTAIVAGSAIAEVRLPVADNQLEFLIDQGKNAKVNLMGTFAGREIIWPAKIARSEGVIDNKSRMSYLVAEIHDPYALADNSLETPVRFGSYVKAKILGLEIAQATSVPRYLVENNRVAILDSESKLHYSEISIVRQDGRNVIVSNGLFDGDQLIVSALDYPIDGMKLALIDDKPKESIEKQADSEEDASQVALNDSDSGE